MGKPITIFRGATGINNKIDPTRLMFDPETGVTDLASAVNVDVDDTGRVMRRDGYVLSAAGAFADLYSMGAYALATKDGYIGTLGADYTFTPLAAVTPGAKVCYASIGSQAFYMNGYEKGIITDGVHAPWTAGSYVGPETNKTFEDPPLGHLLMLFNGHMWVAQSVGGYHMVHHSHRFAYSWFDFASNRMPFPGRVVMMAPVADGFYIGSGGKVYFLQGAIPREMAIREVATCGVYEGSAVRAPAYKLGLDMPGEGIVWGSPEGVWFGADGGMVFNLTEKSLILPDGSRAVGFYSGEKFFCMVEQ